MVFIICMCLSRLTAGLWSIPRSLLLHRRGVGAPCYSRNYVGALQPVRTTLNKGLDSVGTAEPAASIQ